MKVLLGLLSENQLGAWYRIFGDTSLRHDCQIAFQNSKVFKAIQYFWPLSLFQIKGQCLTLLVNALLLKNIQCQNCE